MNKTVKKIVIIGMVCAVCAGTGFAKSRQNFNGTPEKNFPQNFQNCEMQAQNDKQRIGNQAKMNGTGRSDSCEETALIGKIKSVDSANSKITVVNADNKNVELIVSGFTVITDETRKALTLSDVKTDSEVFIKIFKTDTTTKVAGRIFVN